MIETWASRSVALRMHAVSWDTSSRSEYLLSEGMYPSGIAHRRRPIVSMMNLARLLSMRHRSSGSVLIGRGLELFYGWGVCIRKSSLQGDNAVPRAIATTRTMVARLAGNHGCPRTERLCAPGGGPAPAHVGRCSPGPCACARRLRNGP